MGRNLRLLTFCASALALFSPILAGKFNRGPPKAMGYVHTPSFHEVHLDIRSPTPELKAGRFQRRQEPSTSNSSDLTTAAQTVYNYFVGKYPYLNPQTDVAVYDAHLDSQGFAYFLVQLMNNVVIENRQASAAVYKGAIVSSAGNLLSQNETEAGKKLSTTPANTPVDAAKAIVALYYEAYGLPLPKTYALTQKSVYDSATNTTTYEVTGLGDLGFVDPFFAMEEFWVHDNGTLELVWYVDLQDDDGVWIGIVTSAASAAGTNPEIIAIIEYADGIDSQVYSAYPPNGTFDPLTVPPQTYTEGQVINKLASPNGWTTNGTLTAGNNVGIFSLPGGDLTVLNASFASPNFTGVYDIQNPLSTDSINQAMAMLFFWTNYIHDLMYAYGFDEAAGNFQQDNLGRAADGGGDPILGLAQFGSTTCPASEKTCRNNANFATPPDGKAGIMKYYLFDAPTAPLVRDSTVDRDVVAHEIGHGILGRLTGGRRDGNCLESQESGGLNEGFADVVAWTLALVPADTRDTPKTVGAWATGNAVAGIRTYPYTTSITLNPSHYGFLNDPAYANAVHDIGSVWSEMLYEVYWNIADAVKSFGNLDDPKATGSNNIFLHYLLTGMKLQPCNPTFIQARDAFLLADATLGNKVHLCNIWRGFAKRGLGVNATGTGQPWVHKPDWSVPDGCPAVPAAEQVGAATWVQPTATVTIAGATNLNQAAFGYKPASQTGTAAATAKASTSSARAAATGTASATPKAGSASGRATVGLGGAVGVAVAAAAFALL
ncbi:Fungalysin/Thermolysin Extracellular metalloproteinase 5 [Gonapodya sp. JEL0774]|nr:Fungalysin/Thermolysin Extracellular metalloproteinase 5 [Gonapodya sp. JEL0774]